MTRKRRLLAALAVSLGLVAVPGGARAQDVKCAQSPDELACARQRFDEGLSFEAANDWGDALAAFDEVWGIKRTPQVRFHLALCEEHLGRLVSALGKYRLAVDESQGVQGAEDAFSASKEAVGRLEKTVPVVAIKILDAPGRVEVFLDGTPTGSAALGTPVLVDPGQHRLEAKSEGQSAVRSITVSLGQKLEVPLSFKPATADHPAPLQAIRSGSSPGPYVLFGLGAVTVAAGIVGLVIRQNALSQLNDHCVHGHCPSDLASVGERGKVANIVTVAGFATGAAALAAGGLWLGLSRIDHKTSGVSVQALLGSKPGELVSASLALSF